MLTQDPIGLAGGVNLYAYAGNNPIAFDDPYGLCPWCIGAALGVAEGFVIAKLTGQEYGWKDAAVDAALGAVGAGLADKLNDIRQAAKAVDRAADGSKASGVVYRRTNPKTGEQYIGRSKHESSFANRQRAHDRAQNTRHDYEVIDRADGTQLRVAEESAIRQHGGPGKLANKRYEMGEEAYREAGGTVPKP